MKVVSEVAAAYTPCMPPPHHRHRYKLTEVANPDQDHHERCNYRKTFCITTTSETLKEQSKAADARWHHEVNETPKV